MTTYAKHFSTRKTSQTQPIPNKNMVKNNAGGYSFQVDEWTLLERFLILGNEGGSYYCSEQKMTVENAKNVLKCIQKDPQRTLNTIVDISFNGKAPKNDPAIFALALMAGQKGEVGSLALSKLNEVCRIGTHLFQFINNVQQFRGWGDGLKNAVQKWYIDKTEDQLAYQTVKYQQREGVSHRDVLRLCKPKNINSPLMRWIVGKDTGVNKVKRIKNGKLLREDVYPEANGSLPKIIEGFERAKSAQSSQEIVNLITDYNLPRECVPTKWLNDVNVWASLFEKMPMTAMIRNLGKMSCVGLLTPMSKTCQEVVSRLTNKEHLKKARVHPIQLLVALSIYNAGKGLKGSLKWNVDSNISSALDDAFYLAFDNVEPTNKRHLLALDVSGSMGWGNIAGTFLTPSVASAAMAMLAVKTENMTHTMGFSNELRKINLTKKHSLQEAMNIIYRIPMGGTDCSLPMQYALKHKIETDVFVVYTDSETWCGHIHPCQALEKYRQKMGIFAKLIVCGMLSNEFSIADQDKNFGSLDVVGFSTDVPQVMSNFITG